MARSGTRSTYGRVQLPLNDREKKLVLLWSESSISAGHWGDGDAILPEEEILRDKVMGLNGEGTIGLGRMETRILRQWVARGNNGTPEESMLADKISHLLGPDEG